MKFEAIELLLALISVVALAVSLVVLRLALRTRNQQIQDNDKTRTALNKSYTDGENARQAITQQFRQLLTDQHSLAAQAANEQFEKLVHALDEQLQTLEAASAKRLAELDKKQSEMPDVNQLVDQVKATTQEDIERLQVRQSAALEQLKRLEKALIDMVEIQKTATEANTQTDKKMRVDLEDLRIILKRMAESVAGKLAKSEAEIEKIMRDNQVAMRSATLDKFLLLMDSDEERKAAAMSFVREVASEELFAELASRYPSTPALAALEQMCKKSNRQEIFITALSKLASQKLDANLLDDARTLYMQAIDMVQESPDFNPAVLLPIYAKLARLCRIQNDLDYGKVIYKRVIDAQKSMNQEQRQDSMEAMTELIQLFEHNDVAPAKLEDAYKRLHESYIAVGQVEGMVAARNLLKLADLYLLDNRLEEAEPAYQRTLSTFSKALDGEDPELIKLLKHLSSTYLQLNRIDQAEAIQNRLINVLINAKSKDQVIKAVQELEKIAESYASRNSFERAETAYNECAKALRQVLKPNDERITRVYEKLEQLCKKAEDKDQLKKFYEEQMDATRSASSKNASYTNNALKLASLYAADGNVREAESTYKSVDGLKTFDRDTAQFLDEFAKACSGQAKYDLAQSAYEKSLSIKEELLGSGSSELIDSYANLGASYSVQRDYQKAEKMYVRALELTEKNYGFDSEQSITPLMQLAGCYIISGQIGEAEPCYKRILETRYKTQGDEHADIIVSLLHLAELYRIQKNLTESEIFYESACEMAERMYGAESLKVAEILEKQASLAKQDNQQERAVELSDRATKIRNAADADAVVNKTTGADAATR